MANGRFPKSPTAERRAVELGLPAHLLWLSADRLRQEGWTLRGDTLLHLSRASAAGLAGLGYDAVRRCSQRIDQAASAALRDLSFDDPRDGLMSCALLTVKLVDEALFPDPTNQAVLVSMLLLEDARLAGSELPPERSVLRENAGRMLRTLNLQGYFRQFVSVPPCG